MCALWPAASLKNLIKNIHLVSCVSFSHFLTIRSKVEHIWIIAFWLSLQEFVGDYAFLVTCDTFSFSVSFFFRSPNAFSAEKRLEGWLKTLIVFLFFSFVFLQSRQCVSCPTMLLDIKRRLVMIHPKQLLFISQPKYRPRNAM